MNHRVVKAADVHHERSLHMATVKCGDSCALQRRPLGAFPIANAYGPHLADPRSGEILNANIVQLQQDWCITQVGPLEPGGSPAAPDRLPGQRDGAVAHACWPGHEHPAGHLGH